MAPRDFRDKTARIRRGMVRIHDSYQPRVIDMRQTSCFATAVFGLCLAIASPAAFADDGAPPDLGAIRAQQLELRSDIQAGSGPFKDMNSAERRRLAERQARLLALLEGKDSIDELDETARLDAFNLLQEINAAVTGVEGDQLVCEYVRKTGSHRKTKQCMTMAERRRAQEETEEYLRKEFQRGMFPPST